MHPLIALGSAAAFLFSGAAGTLVQSEQQVLDNFKASQANTGSTLFWDSAAPLCGQPGILCSGDSEGEQHVTELNLRGLSLGGTFPQDFGQLSQLQKLDVSINSFTGSIPSGISWPLLTVFLAEFNEFSGELPSDLFSAPDIQFFNVSSNQLTGTIPSGISSWDQLQSLDLSSNEFYGTIPEDFINLASLIAFNVRDNHLVGELPAFTFSQFETFEALGSNQLCPYADYSSVPTNDYTAAPSTCLACSEFSCQNGATCIVTQGETPTEPQQGQGETPTEAPTDAPTDAPVEGGLFGGGRKRLIQPQFTCQCLEGYSGQFCHIVAAPSTQPPVTVTQTATTIPQSTTVEQTTTVQITSTIQPSATVQPTTTVQPSTTVQETTTLLPTTTVLPTVIVQPTTVIQPTTTVIVQPSTVTQATVTTTIPPATYTQTPTTVVQPTATTTVPPATVTVLPSSTATPTVTTVTTTTSTATATATSTATASPTTTGGVFPDDEPTGQGTSGVAGLLPAYLLPFALALVGFYFLNL